MKEKIKRLFAVNGYSNAFLYTTLSAKGLKEMKATCAEAAKDDSIASVDWIRQFRRDVGEGRRRFFTTDCNFSNAHIYGIWHSVFGDCGLDPILTPSVEHGLIFHNQIFNDLEDTARAACATFGDFRKEIIRRNTGIPIFRVGPYIHYAKPFYDEERLAREKAKNGRTLLVFPMHSTDTSTLSTETQRYIDYLRDKSRDYDTVLINSFWWNLNDPLTLALEAEGYRIVSAGFRDDVMFMSRLKTLIQMADLVVGDSIGTHVGYCIDCGVPFSYEPLGSKVALNTAKENRDLDFCQQHMQPISDACYHAEAITDEQRRLCAYYWGTDHVRTREELQDMAEITAEIMRRSRGWSAKYPSVARKLLGELSGGKEALLRDALE